MRKLEAKALAWSALAMATAGAAGGTGCKAAKATELVPGVSTQMVVTRDLNEIRIDVEANGGVVFCHDYPVSSDGVVQLPGTLGVIPETKPDTVVTITVRGYDVAGTMGQDNTTCPPIESAAAPVDAPASSMTGQGPRIIRRSIQSYVNGHILFVPMPLTYSCQDVDCSMMGEKYACKGGLCVDSTITDPSTLADYDPTLLDGTGLCFSPMSCLAPGDAVPATLIDADKCIYGFPGWDTSLAGSGANVRVFYKDIAWQPDTAGGYRQVLVAAGEEEILNEDATEGFTIVNAADAGLPEASTALPGVDAGSIFNANGPLIQLAPGLCALAHAASTPPPQPVSGRTYHTISDVQIASACPPKEPLLPICAMERNNLAVLPDGGGTTDGVCNVAVPMDPAPSAVYLVADDSVYMHGAYGATGSAEALSLSLTDPVFERTFAAFKFLNDPNKTDCTATPTSYASQTLPACTGGVSCTFDLAGDLQPKIASQLQSWMQPEVAVGNTCSGTGSGVASGCAANQYCFDGACYIPSPLDLQGAMRRAGAYAQVESFLTQSGISAPNIAAVMFIVNRAPVATAQAAAPPEAGDCVTPPTDAVPVGASAMPGDCGIVSTAACNAQTVIENEALNAFSTNGLKTYFVVLANDDGSTEAIDYFNQVASDVPQAVTTLDATMLSSVSGGVPTSMAAQQDVASFLSSVTKIGTCLYDLPASVPSGTSASTLEVSFSPPGAPPGACGAGRTCVPFVAGCTAASEAGANPPDGWSYDGNNRIRICGASCAQLRQYTIAAAQTQAAVPVTIATLCSGTTSDAGSTVGSGPGIDSGGAGGAILDAAVVESGP